jgi:hypothetical protein
MNAHNQWMLFIFILMLAGCQGHLPELETSPKAPGPKTEDIINHINCELATAVNYQPPEPETALNARIKSRVAAKHDLAMWLKDLQTYHFVASAAISVEVTDNQSFTPTLNYLNESGSLTVTLGGQLNGTQDRSLTINYAIDLFYLVNKRDQYCSIPTHDSTETAVLKKMGLTGAIAGDLGLADIIADGLIALHTSQDVNLYGSTGPVAPIIARQIGGRGQIVRPGYTQDTKPKLDWPRATYAIDALDATLQVSPQAPGAPAQGTVSLAGTATLSYAGQSAKYLLNWSGSLLPQIGNPPTTPALFSLTGTMTPLPGIDGLVNCTAHFKDCTNSIWGYAPTITLTGSIDPKTYDASSMKLTGTLTPASNSVYEKADLITVNLTQAQNAPPPLPPPPAERNFHFRELQTTPVAPAQPPAPTTAPVAPAGVPTPPAGGGGGGGAGGGGGGASVKGSSAPSSSGAGGTSFGSLVDFILVYGVNGGPNWSFQRFKGPAASGTSPLLAATRTKTDSLAITFVATCQDYANYTEIPPKPRNYWDSVGACSPTDVIAQQIAAGVGYQNNTLMILRRASF